MASAVMASPANIPPRSPAVSSATAVNSPRRNLKRPAPVSAGPHSRPVIPSIKTPGLSSLRSPGLSGDKILPSQLPRSPASPWSAGIRNDSMKTPITPPSAYSDFLQALSPAMSTPATARSSASTFSFTDRNGHLTPITQPPSAASFSGNSANASKRRAPLPASIYVPPPPSAAASAPLLPPSPFVRPRLNRRSSSARSTTSLHKLTIPDSPSFSPITESAGNSAITRTPASASKPRSAQTLAEARSAVELRSPFSPTSWYQEGRTRTVIEPPKSAGGMQTVSVRQVVTRTVTYTRTPLEPAPKRRRRRGPGEAATPIDPRLMPFSERREKPVKREEDAQSDYTTASDLTGSSVTDSDASERRSEKEGSADTAVAIKVEGPVQTATAEAKA